MSTMNIKVIFLYAIVLQLKKTTKHSIFAKIIPFLLIPLFLSLWVPFYSLCSDDSLIPVLTDLSTLVLVSANKMVIKIINNKRLEFS